MVEPQFQRAHDGLTDDEVLDALHTRYLARRGWLRSVQLREAVDLDGPIPWLTYPAIDFLAGLSRPTWSVFEYGAGSSTLWWEKRVARLVSVEHDAAWAEQVRQSLKGGSADVLTAPSGAEEEPSAAADVEAFFALGLEPVLTSNEGHNARSGLHWEPYRGYASMIGCYPKGAFDVVVVDGMARSLTAWMASRWVKADGLIVFDNSDRETYRPGYQLLQEAGFARIDFWGLGAVNPYEWCTSVFIRSLAVLTHPSGDRSGG